MADEKVHEADGMMTRTLTEAIQDISDELKTLKGNSEKSGNGSDEYSLKDYEVTAKIELERRRSGSCFIHLFQMILILKALTGLQMPF